MRVTHYKESSTLTRLLKVTERVLYQFPMSGLCEGGREGERERRG